MCLLNESLKITDGKIENLFFHNRRLNTSRNKLFGSTDIIDLTDHISITEENSEGIFKCRIIYSEKIESVEYLPYVKRDIKSLRLLRCDDIDYSLKYADREKLENLLEKRRGCDDIITVKNGFLTDTSFSNIALFNGQEWLTPARPLLAGTKREKLITEGILKEDGIRPDDIGRFQKISLINAMVDLGELEISTSEIFPE